MNVGGGTGNWKKWVRGVAFAMGLLLIGAACLAVWRERSGLEEAWRSVRAGRWLLVGGVILLPCVNWLLTSVMFWALMPGPKEAHGAPTVGVGEMTRLIGAAWLANYLPARPGFFGRLAYHKAVNDISVTRALAAMFGAIACGGVAVGLTLAITVWLPGRAWGLAVPAVVLCALAGVLWRWGLWGRCVLALGMRYVDVLVWMGRYFAAFALVGRPLSATEAAAMAAVSQVAMLVPFVGNGLGVREWAIRLAAPALPVWLAGADALTGPTALSADLLNRAGEIIAAIPVGLVCGAGIASRIARLTPRGGS